MGDSQILYWKLYKVTGQWVWGRKSECGEFYDIQVVKTDTKGKHSARWDARYLAEVFELYAVEYKE
jgi:hypothetical protein